MEGAGVIKSLWDFVINLAKGMGDVWEWLSTSHYIGLRVDWLGINFGFDLVPLHLTGGVLVVLAALAFVKAFIPVA